jgi:hypothetical protein
MGPLFLRGMQAMEEERRKFDRLKPDKPVAAKVRAFVPGKVVDVSAEGLLIRVQKRLAVGAVYAMQLAFPGREIAVRGTVNRCELVGFDTNDEADRVRAYHAALVFEHLVPELTGRLRPGDVLDVRMEPESVSD